MSAVLLYSLPVVASGKKVAAIIKAVTKGQATLAMLARARRLQTDSIRQVCQQDEWSANLSMFSDGMADDRF